jgi:hypothetical protein
MKYSDSVYITAEIKVKDITDVEWREFLKKLLEYFQAVSTSYFETRKTEDANFVKIHTRELNDAKKICMYARLLLKK